MSQIGSQLAATAALADQKQKVEQYKAVLQSVVSSAAVEEAKQFIDHSECAAQPRPAPSGDRSARPRPTGAPCPAVLSDDVPLTASRQLLVQFAQDISKLPADVHKPIAT